MSDTPIVVTPRTIAQAILDAQETVAARQAAEERRRFIRNTVAALLVGIVAPVLAGIGLYYWTSHMYKRKARRFLEEERREEEAFLRRNNHLESSNHRRISASAANMALGQPPSALTIPSSRRQYRESLRMI